MMNEFYVFLIFNFLVDFLLRMPDESCRYCGGKLIDFSQCAECKGITRKICKSCRGITIEQFHSACMMGILKTQNTPTIPVKNLYGVSLA